MKKLRLELDRLAVETFATGEKSASAGTVRGHATTTKPAVDTQESCNTLCGGDYTAYYTCEATCEACVESNMCLTQPTCAQSCNQPTCNAWPCA